MPRQNFHFLLEIDKNNVLEKILSTKENQKKLIDIKIINSVCELIN